MNKKRFCSKIRKEGQIQEKTDKLEIHIIDLNRFKEIKNPKGELADWLNLILGNEGEIKMASERNEKIAKANEDNKKLSATKEMQELYWLKQKYIYDENTRISVATEKGERKKQLEIAKNMLNEKMSIEVIAKVTGLNKEEIEKIK